MDLNEINNLNENDFNKLLVNILSSKNLDIPKTFLLSELALNKYNNNKNSIKYKLVLKDTIKRAKK